MNGLDRLTVNQYDVEQYTGYPVHNQPFGRWRTANLQRALLPGGVIALPPFWPQYDPTDPNQYATSAGWDH